jgi:uncharacterized repeat protein (TIGR01451 family)
MGVLIGGDVTFTMTATNVGKGTATGVKVVGTLPVGLTYGSVPGVWQTILFGSVDSWGKTVSTASALNASKVQQQHAVSLLLHQTAAPALRGIVLPAAVCRAAPYPAAELTRLTMHAMFDHACCLLSPAGCSIVGQTITCDVASLAPGASVDFTVPVKATAPGLHNFTASVTADGDSNASNNGPSGKRLRVRQTCGVYNSDGSRFNCGPLLRYNASAGSNPNPSSRVCCTSRPIDPESGAEISLTANLARRINVGDVADLVMRVTAVEESNTNVMLTFTLPPGLEMVQVPAGEFD